MARLFILSICPILLLCCFGAVRAENVLLSRLNLLLAKTDKLINYYRDNYPRFNFDGLFGIHVLQNHISSIVRSDNEYLFEPILSDLRRKLSTIDEFLPDALQTVKNQNSSYFAKLGKLYKLSWSPESSKFLFDSRNVVQMEKVPVALKENVSDDCLANLFQNFSEATACRLPNSCILYLRQTGLLGYQLMHQILIVSVLGKLKCQSAVNDFLSDSGYSIASMEASLCTAAFDQFQSLTTRPVDVNARDLVLEQILLCGSAGYLQFASFRLLGQLLSWQHASGCFSDISVSNSPFLGRKLLTEMRISDGCLSHMTSVAAGAMGVYLSTFLTPNSQIDGQLNLYENLRSCLHNERVPTLPKLLEEPNLPRSRDSLPWSPSVDPSIIVRLNVFHGFPLDSVNNRESVLARISLSVTELQSSYPIPVLALLLVTVLFCGCIFRRQFRRRRC